MTDTQPALDLVDDLPALVAHLRERRSRELVADLLAVSPALRAREGALEAVRHGLKDWQRSYFDAWVERIVLAEAPQTLAAFCAIATERARLHDPSFPKLTDADLTLTSSSSMHGSREKETEGWTLQVDGHYEGPAEIISVDEWRAIARGDGWSVEVRYEASNDRGYVWEEPAGG